MQEETDKLPARLQYFEGHRSTDDVLRKKVVDSLYQVGYREGCNQASKAGTRVPGVEPGKQGWGTKVPRGESWYQEGSNQDITRIIRL